MLDNMRIITTIRGPEPGDRPIKCSVVWKPVDSSRVIDLYGNKVVYLSLFVDPVLAAILWRLLNESKIFCIHFMIWLFDQWKNKDKSDGSKCNKLTDNNYLSLSISNVKSSSKNICLRFEVTLQLMLPKILNITPDIRWSNRLWPLLVEFAHLNDIMSWLSTLGGAYSSLGEKCSISSQKAGEISKQQFVIATKLKNPILTAQCNVFLAMSLAQRGCLKSATIIIRQQHADAISNSVHDTKLISMCKAVWNKIRYMKQLKFQAKREVHQICAGKKIVAC